MGVELKADVGREQGQANEPLPIQTRARAHNLSSVRDRVALIAQMMRDVVWQKGRSGPALAEVWGVSLSCVQNYSSEAHRLVVSEVQDPTEVGRTVCAALEKVVREATGDGDRRNVIRAADTWATIAGAKAAERLDVSTTVEATPTAAQHVMRELFGAVTPTTADDAPEDDAAEPERGSDEDASGT